MLSDYPIIEYSDDFANVYVTIKDLNGLMYALDDILMKEIHEVSYYADDFHGNGTAFGDTFDMYALTAAHRTYPSNTLVKVTNVDNRKSVVVRINDRGPYVDGRDMDLSLAAFEKIADRSNGVISATFQRLGDEFMIDTCTEDILRFQKRITRNVRFHRGIPHMWNKGETLYLGANKYFVVRSIQYPDGFVHKVQNWVGPKERFSFTPEQTGYYKFVIGNKDGRSREMGMMVRQCEVVVE
ncbi:septal ring lytic transglycosylase RlpA family protein [Patescibacteria group bacterium]|nr:septal ring lytic transglycosylase RlpA family protein [Patescibacteria group bacterium]MBU1123776.1 septal ring lytic transglycosylase RlpA family protein [Patescibacteria group bacterium]MBU1911686.1 septal ring lytic transglycosylase RlpA family protein [Patescibacteria group bacterium]